MDEILSTSRITPNNSCGARILSSIKTKGTYQTIIRDALLWEGQGVNVLVTEMSI
ncbi:hypothetical protein Godav_001110 [Gossypium davidsonii]|uniref:Uncharacterized protein n=2 Tax=Gossypium TaxID=3633 RepID=A0A7J8T1X7_GOSDV|nr:hypothetical protein [Gossypium davidsonii]MBA0668116.1 hypothetical protein [Gossypium klotzschianum]